MFPFRFEKVFYFYRKFTAMIKTTEVRRGNLVQYAIKDSKGNVPAAFKKPLIVDEIRDNFFMITDNLGFEVQFAESQVEGVPLTPAILQNTEFKKVQFYVERAGTGYYWGVGKFRLLYNDIKNVFYYSHTDTELPYLHQLQNLFFALTGEELNIPYKTF